jgi:hypothetical protein
LRKLVLLFLIAAAGAASAQIESDWERENADRLKQADEQVVPPPRLDRARLLALALPRSADTDFRYYVDPGSVSVGADRIVRYVLLVRSPSGAENVSFEGIRCPDEYRVYAVGRADGSWGGRATEWRPIPRNSRAGQNALSRSYFCPARQAIVDADEGRNALRAGGHPGVFVEQR